MTEPLRYAPNGAIWVCRACGKTDKDRYGGRYSSWDDSCMLNAVLCHERQHFNAKGELGWLAFSEPLPVSALSTTHANEETTR